MSGSEAMGSATPPLVRSDLPLPLRHRGKVREMYDAGGGRLLMVASDRISAFDVVMAEPVPRKGEVLTLLTAWWLAGLRDSPNPLLRGLRHHALEVDPERIAEAVPALADCWDQWARRSILVKATEPLPVECVVRGYLAGSAWAEYRQDGTLAGEALPTGLVEAQRLEAPLFSPATKAVEGHDINIPFARVEEGLGRKRARRLREFSLALYEHGARAAGTQGVILADTKFEFGLDAGGEIVLIDEILTPDSSRYWPREGYVPGRTPPSLDKQPVRDYLAGLPDWDRTPPPPALPGEVVEATTDRYLEIFRRLTGGELDRFIPPRLEGEEEPVR
jgi:phosphoribosylaminoimidazole-succinocarboxamide synthase